VLRDTAPSWTLTDNCIAIEKFVYVHAINDNDNNIVLCKTI